MVSGILIPTVSTTTPLSLKKRDAGLCSAVVGLKARFRFLIPGLGSQAGEVSPDKGWVIDDEGYTPQGI